VQIFVGERGSTWMIVQFPGCCKTRRRIEGESQEGKQLNVGVDSCSYGAIAPCTLIYPLPSFHKKIQATRLNAALSTCLRHVHLFGFAFKEDVCEYESSVASAGQ
jgi:hypothetical protein